MSFDSLVWKIKQWFRKAIPLALLGALSYGGYTMYRDGAFKRGVGPAVNYVLRKMPFFGSKFGHYRRHGQVAKSSSAYRRSSSGRRSYSRPA